MLPLVVVIAIASTRIRIYNIQQCNITAQTKNYPSFDSSSRRRSSEREEEVLEKG